jgi:hypothetical protein
MVPVGEDTEEAQQLP